LQNGYNILIIIIKKLNIYCNPAGDWSIGGFEADTGVTGRKLAVDNYGPRVPLGGGAFSGKRLNKKLIDQQLIRQGN